MSITVTASTSVVLVNTTSATNTVLLPYLSTVGRLITIRDNTGFAQTSTITVSTTGGAVFYDGSTSLTINQPFGFVTLSVLSGGTYAILNTFAFPSGNAAASVGTLTTSNILLNDRGTSNYYPFYSSNASLYFISTPIGDITLADLQSTVNGLGSAGYLSSLTVPVIPTYVAVGATSNQVLGTRNPLGSIVYSLTNGASWTNAGGTTGFLTQGWDVAYNEGFYVACGDNSDGVTPTTPGHLQWSADGITWSYSTTALGSNQARSRVIYANGLWHSVGSNSATTGGVYSVVYSLNGKSWFPSVSSPEFPPQATGIAFGAGVWVFTGSNATSPQRSVQWSLDGSNWNAAASVSWINGQAGDVAYDGTRFIVLVSGGTNPNASNIAVSVDGSNWTGLGLTGGNLNFAGPVQGTLAVEPDTSNWLMAPFPGATVGFGQLVKRSITGGTAWLSNTNVSGLYRVTRPYYDGTKWWAGFQTQPFGTPQTATGQAMYYSFDDGQTWQNTNITGGFSNGGYPNGMVVSPPTIDYGLQLQSTVTGLEQQFTTGLLTVLGPQNVRNQWVAVGQDSTPNGTIKYSSDGINWCNANSGGFNGVGSSVVYSGQFWLAGGSDPNPLASIKYSYDGSNWSNSESGITVTQGIGGIAYNGSLFVAAGSGVLFYSFTGSNWYVANTQPMSGPRTVAWNGYMWVVVGSDNLGSNIGYSFDGSNWSNANSGFFDVWGYDVAWNNYLWIATGNNSDPKGTIKYSYDGSNWSNIIFGGFEGLANGVTWNGTTWYATGYGVVPQAASPSNIQYSTDGSNWFRVTSSVFNQQGNTIATNGSLLVAGGSNPGNSALVYSYDGLNYTNSTGASFSVTANGIAFSDFKTPDITMTNLNFYTKQQQTYFTSSHTIATTDDVMNIDNTLFIDRPNRRVGILTSSPTVALEVNGTMKTTSLDVVNLTNNVQVIDSLTLQGPLYASNIYVATGYSNASGTQSNQVLKWSYDGFNWNNNASGGFIFTFCLPVYGTRCNTWVVSGTPANVSTSNLALQNVQWSTDGSNWNNATSGDFVNRYGGNINPVVFTGTNYVFMANAPGTQGLYFSPDGKNWTFSSNITINSNTFWPSPANLSQGFGLTYMSNTGVVVGTGDSEALTYMYEKTYYSKDNGSNFQTITSNSDTEEAGTPYTSAASLSKILVLARNTSLTARILSSTDGSNFVRITTDFSGEAANAQMYYAGGIWFITQNNINTTSKLYYSSNDGSNWYAVPLANFSPNLASGDAALAVSYDGILWYSGTTNSGVQGRLYSSSNLTNWSTIGTSALYNQVCVGIQSALNNATILNKIITNSIGVGNNNPQYAVDITGQLRVTSTILAQAGVLSNGVYLTSDSNVKENITTANYNLCYSNVKDLTLKRFRFISSYAATKQDQTQLGFIAQEAQQLFPKSVIELPGLNYGPPTLHLNTDQIFMTHYGATRYLMDVVETQDATISTLLSQVEQMKERVVRYTSGI